MGDVWDAESVAAAVHSARPRVVLISVQSRPGQRPMPYVGAARHVVEAARDMDVKQIFWIGQAGVQQGRCYPGGSRRSITICSPKNWRP